MHLFSSKSFGIIIISLLALTSCKPTEDVTVVEEAPVARGQSDTTFTQRNTDESFRQLTVGEINPISTLDPLFADNTSTMRLIQQIYEGLVRYDQNGQIIPASAKSWTISDDSLTYHFTLRDDLYYHDSYIFAGGRGHLLAAEDVKKAFERMAKASVPMRAAQLFMNIRGFEPYFQEQHQVLIASHRHLSGVKGIKTPNDSTVVFQFVTPDDAFLMKLASPLAVIYPMEAVPKNNDTDHFVAVGTGPFYLSQNRDNSHYILAQFDEYHDPDQPKIDRLDVIIDDQTNLLGALKRGEIQIIPQLGPRHIQSVVSTSGDVAQAYRRQYRLYNPDSFTSYSLHFNEDADAAQASVAAALNRIDKNSFFPKAATQNLQIDWSLPTDASVPPADSISVTRTSDPFVKYFLETLANQLAENAITLQMKALRIPTRNVELYFTHQLFDYNGSSVPRNLNTIVTLQVPHIAIAQEKVQNLNFNRYTWWINLRPVTVSTVTNL